MLIANKIKLFLSAIVKILRTVVKHFIILKICFYCDVYIIYIRNLMTLRKLKAEQNNLLKLFRNQLFCITVVLEIDKDITNVI